MKKITIRLTAAKQSMTCSLVVAMLGLLLPVLGQAADREFRAFAVAYRHDVESVRSRAAFEDSIRTQFEAQVVPHLRDDVPNLVSFPENQTLMSYLLGPRGELARAALEDGGSTAAIASLGAVYAPQIAYYEAKFPGTTSPGQLLQLALTDSLARSVIEFFSGLAAEYGVWLSVCSNLAEFERVEGAAASLLAEPDGDTSYAYEAVAAPILNRNFIFGPNGELLTIQDKAYLVPSERDQAAGLGLTGIETWQLPVYDLPFARVATVISKDAWMIDVNDRLDQLGAELLLQPEAFSTWGVSGDDLWPPDKFQRGGWWMLQKQPAAKVNLTPMLTGNFGDLSFDGQPLIAVQGPKGEPELCLMGQVPEYGWSAVGQWSNLSEPAAAFCDPARRPELAEQGVAIAPGSGDARENQYASDTVFADIRLPAIANPAPALPTFSVASEPVLASETAQLLPRLAMSDSTIVLGWIDSFSETNQNVALSRLQDDGAWGAPSRPAPSTETAFDHFDNQWAPALVASDESLVLAWLEFTTENWDLFSAREQSGQVSARVRVDDADANAGVNRERGHSSPRLLSLADGRILAIWSDLRWPWIKPQIRLASSDDNGASWSPSVRVDGAALAFEDEQLDGRDPNESAGQSFADAVEFAGKVFVSWQEADASGQQSIKVAELDQALNRLTVVSLEHGQAAYRPRLLTDSESLWLVYERETEQGGSHLLWRSRTPESGWGDARRVDLSAGAAVRQRFAEPVLTPAGPAVVFSDNRAGNDDIVFSRFSGDRPVRLDDRAGDISSVSPAAVVVDDAVLAVWQDETEQGPRLRSVRAPLAMLDADLQRRRSGANDAWFLLILMAAIWRHVWRDPARKGWSAPG